MASAPATITVLATKVKRLGSLGRSWSGAESSSDGLTDYFHEATRDYVEGS